MSMTEKLETVWFTTKGQVVIPLRLRKQFDIEDGTKAVVQATPEGILLKPVTAALIRRGVTSLPCIGDGRQSGTSGSPSILNASPEAAADGGLAILRTGDKVRIDLNKGSANILIPEEEVKQRRTELKAKGGFPYPAHQTPWQELYRQTVGQQATGACMEFATRYHDIAGKVGVARDNH